MKRILLTGSAGFIGSHLAERLLRDGYAVTGVDNFDPFYPRAVKEDNLSALRDHPHFTFRELDLTQPNGLAQVTEPIDVVMHLAAKAGVRPSIENPLSYLDYNVSATNYLLEWMKEKQVRNFVFASSSSVYGNRKEIPFRETDNVDYPISPYAFSKKACELLNHTYHHLYGINTVNLRFFTVFGPRQRPDLAINKFVRQILNGQPLTMFGDGSTARDYTFVEDTVDGICRAIEYVQAQPKVFETFNLGNHKPTQLSELIHTLYELLGREPNIQQLPMQPGDVSITCASTEKAKELLGYEPSTSLREGLQKFIDWYHQKNHLYQSKAV
ncbi:Nucleoside-diphosphate-sugar epimerase [Catalinimonas alkaloidigena]|uniref:Nucleoside-diphosphate-sugar epimerase n=1 Tax=Catalinimonas alkaloidigena TaxID=1075417 RepID=A0A1G8XAC2_9BACT|nr:NAD-dependent epimerase/dehydratase family protein [Catalinimonas alkaloidigena]SDJ87433.1 Nucleoside-diphosphate-sugar epimerase [Catalinimonas alkaloidigena]